MRLSAGAVITLISLAVLSVTLVAGLPAAAAMTTASNCASPTVPTGHMPALNSTFTLVVIGATGQTVTFNQNSIFSLPSCTSLGGFVSHGTPTPQNYGNYTGIPVQTLINLVGGMTSTETVTATSGTDGYQVTYTYSEVTAGTGWGNVYTTTSLTTAVTSPPPMYLVLAYLWNGNPIGAYACIGATAPCSNGPTTSDVGPLRTTTITTGAGYLISAGGPWNKGVTTIQVNPPETAIKTAAQSVTGTVGGGVPSSASIAKGPSGTNILETVGFSTASGASVGFEVPTGTAGFVTYQITNAAGLLVGYTQIPLVNPTSLTNLYGSLGYTLTAIAP